MDPVSLVILNHNGRDVLKHALQSAYINRPHEIIVVDNASTDDSWKIAYEWGARVVHADNEHKFITGLNEAIRSVKTDIILFQQEDVQLADNALSQMQIALSLFGWNNIYQPVLRNIDGSINHAGCAYVWPGLGIGYQIVQNVVPYRVPLFSTACFMMHKVIWSTQGLFDELFSPAYYEDVDYSIRNNFNCYVVPDAHGVHLSTFTFHKTHSKQQLAEYCKVNRRKLVNKHYRGLDRLARLAALSAIDLISSGKSHLHGDTYTLPKGDHPEVTGAREVLGSDQPSPPR